jgi:tetratricopeptide (TPR) repeat protein
MISLVDFYNSLNKEEKSCFSEVCQGDPPIVAKIDYSKCNLLETSSIVSNLHFFKHYEIAIKLLNYSFKFAKKKEDVAQFHIGYAMNYEKLKDIEKCNYHCEEAIRLFHFGTYSYKRLIINYVKAKNWENALRAIDMVFKNEAVFDHRKFFKDKPSQWEELSSYALKRKEFILKKIDQ